MEIFLIRALQFVLAISILILIHEGGHFMFAKMFGIRVEKFFIFFDPWFHLFQFKPKKSDTTYGIGWLPLGGYCKIAGMIDESFDTEQMKQPAQPWEFRTKPAWQRLLVMIGGVLFNFLFARWGLKYDYFFAVAAARIISSAVNYAVNRKAVFGRGDGASVVRYYTLAAGLLVTSGILGTAITRLIPVDWGWLDTVIKTAVDLLLFAVSFRIQNDWVFKTKKGDHR